MVREKTGGMSKGDVKLIGKKIRELRKSKNVTQEQLAEVLSVSFQAVSKWENNNSTPDIELLPIMARYFGVTMDELFEYPLDSLNYRERFVKFMVDNRVLQFGEYRLSRGRISPYFIDTGNYNSGSRLFQLGEFYAECIRDHGIQTDVLFGPSVKSIPLAIVTSMVLFNKYNMDVNYCFRRTSKCTQEHEMLVGKKLEDGQHVTIIEDTLSSGKALREAISQIRNMADVSIDYVVISVDRMERGQNPLQSAIQEIEREFGVHIVSIVTLDDVIQAIEKGVITEKRYLEKMRNYRREFGSI